MRARGTGRYNSLLLGVAAICLWPAAAAAQTPPSAPRFNIAPQSLDDALREFGTQAGVTIMADAAITANKTTSGYASIADPGTALRALLRGTGLTYRHQGDVFVISRATSISTAVPEVGQTGVPADPAPTEADTGEVVVTAQRREEALQAVPIAVTAISGQKLDSQKIETGGELVRAVPNVNFSKTNFSSFNFTIRGIGTKAISASSDPAVAVSFNSTPLIRSRLFEQEFFDISRVEVLRGPQGTLYGRNATAGVVNVLPQLPTQRLEGRAWIEAGNYGSMRASGTINLPLTDTLAVRAAGAYTYRNGFDYNSFTDTHVNGRDLYSTRLSALWKPSDNFRASFIWQHFNENDDRSRSGKALCTRDPGLARVGSTPVPESLRPRLSQGCLPGSLYDDAAFGAPNGDSFPNIAAMRGIFVGNAISGQRIIGGRPFFSLAGVSAVLPGDPYRNVVQSRDLREISTTYDPKFRARNDVFQLNLDLGVSDGLRLFSQSLYSRDRYFQTQDYYRFVSAPIFADSARNDFFSLGGFNPIAVPPGPGPSPGGVFTDPQLGASDRITGVDLSRSRNRQWSQELRLQSDWTGAFNFSLGMNYLDFKSQDDYFVFNNTFSYIAKYFYNSTSGTSGQRLGTRPCNPTGPNDDSGDCIYVDPNSIDEINELGRNYFLSRNLVRTKSAAIFGEAYYNVTDKLKLTAGLRFTDDRKIATPVPSQLLLGIGNATGRASGGLSAIGLLEDPDVRQRWRRFSGRFVVDWKPDLSFTDDTLLYASYARGYKGGGTNPPRVAINPNVIQFQPLPDRFRPEYVNAFEIGAKNSFDNGRLTLNLTGFYYDYKGYQVSQIVDRISLNENFDARSMGLELEAAWRPTRAFQVDANFGFLDTRVGKGQGSIDVMNRTQGNPDWVLLRPYIQVPSNCVAPRDLAEAAIARLGEGAAPALYALCSGSLTVGAWSSAIPVNFGQRYDRILGTREYNPLTDAPNGGRGFLADLSGNDLPNAPRYTMNVGAQYTLELGAWSATLRGDYYRQGKSFARIYNTLYDRLRAWDNLNLTLTIARPADDFAVQFYVKNVFDTTPITDTFTNSDDTGLTANIFTLDPRLFAVRLSKSF